MGKHILGDPDKTRGQEVSTDRFAWVSSTKVLPGEMY